MSNRCRFATLTPVAYRDCPCAVRAVVCVNPIRSRSTAERSDGAAHHSLSVAEYNARHAPIADAPPGATIVSAGFCRARHCVDFTPRADA